MPELNEETRGWLAELKSTFESRRSDFAWAEAVGGYSTSGGDPVIAHMVIRLRPKEDKQSESRIDYRHFTLFKRAMEPQTGWSLFEDLTRGASVEIGGTLPSLKFGSCILNPPERWNSKSYPALEEWPTDVGILQGTQDGRLRHELLVSKDGPIFTGPQEAINETSGVHVGWRGFAPTIYLLIPDRRCRIGGLKISTKSVSCQVERGCVPNSGLVLKAYASAINSNLRMSQPLNAFAPPSQFELDEPDGTSNLEVGFFPNHLIMVLIDKGLDKVLDSREYESSRTWLAPDISIEADAPYIADLIRGGESERVEFKAGFDGNDGWLKSVCAFSNGDGGTIFFGVDDDGTVRGVSEPKTPEWVAQKVTAHLEPFPSYQFTVVELEGKRVAYVDVASGAEKPYWVKGQGCYVRAKATTRQATRNELLLLARAAFGVQNQ